MNKYRVSYIILLLTVFVISMFYPGRLAVVILAALIAAPLLSLGALIIAYFSLTITVTPSELTLCRKEQAAFSITVSNRSLFPLFPILIGTRLLGENRQIIMSIPPLGNVTTELGGCYHYRGEYHEGIEWIKLYDFMKLFTLKKRINRKVSSLVMPRKINIGVQKNEDVSESGEMRSAKPFAGQSDFSDVREYREGDQLKLIHWKLSAKQDELQVRQQERGKNTDALIVSEISAVFKDEDISREAADLAVEITLSAADYVLLGGEAAELIWSENDGVGGFRADGRNDYQKLFGTMSSLAPSSERLDYHKLFSDFGSSFADKRRIFFIAPTVTEETAEQLCLMPKETRSITTVLICAPEQQNAFTAGAAERLVSCGITVIMVHEDSAAEDLQAIANIKK